MDILAVGDVVNGIGALGAVLTIQPAAGVDLLINSVAMYNSWFLFTDGALSARIGYLSSTTGSRVASMSTCRLFIDNSIYLSIEATAGYSNAYSGIQIK